MNGLYCRSALLRLYILVVLNLQHDLPEWIYQFPNSVYLYISIFVVFFSIESFSWAFVLVYIFIPSKPWLWIKFSLLLSLLQTTVCNIFNLDLYPSILIGHSIYIGNLEGWFFFFISYSTNKIIVCSLVSLLTCIFVWVAVIVNEWWQ